MIVERAKREGCQFPDNTPSTGYKYGCRCEMCVGMNRERVKMQQYRNPKGHSRRRKRNNWKYNLKHKYGISAQQREDMGNVCEICGSTKTVGRNKWLNVDHNHVTKKIRGILCSRCNWMLAHVKADFGTEIIEKALEYVKSSQPSS